MTAICLPAHGGCLVFIMKVTISIALYYALNVTQPAPNVAIQVLTTATDVLMA